MGERMFGRQVAGSEAMTGDWIKPLFDRVVVRIPRRERQSKGGIIYPDTVRDNPNYQSRETPPLEGVVVAVGPGGQAPDGAVLTMQLKVGDRVLMHNFPTCGVRVFRRGSVTELTESKESGDEGQVPYIIMGQTDVLCVLPGEGR